MSQDTENVSEVGTSEDEELQLHEDERTPKDKKRKRKIETADKLDAIRLARSSSVRNAAKKHGVQPHNVRGWIKNEAELLKQL